MKKLASPSILQNFSKSFQILDNLIFQLEKSTGQSHKNLPFSQCQSQDEKSQKTLVKETQQPQKEARKAKKTSLKDNQQSKEKTQKETDPFEDFSKLDIRVGRITDCWIHPESSKLYCEKIDIGEPEQRQIASGLQSEVPIEEMKGLVLVLSNLKPRPLAGFLSNGMILCASSDSKVEILRPHPDSQVGERVILESYEKIDQERQKVIKSSKVLEKVFPSLKTNDNCIACYQNQRLLTSKGEISAQTIKNGLIS